MRLIKVEPQTNGAHLNQNGGISYVPEGWAVIPEDMETPNFPFGSITVEKIDGIPTVTSWVAGAIPEVEPEPEQEASADEILNTLLGVTIDE